MDVATEETAAEGATEQQTPAQAPAAGRRGAAMWWWIGAGIGAFVLGSMALLAFVLVPAVVDRLTAELGPSTQPLGPVAEEPVGEEAADAPVDGLVGTAPSGDHSLEAAVATVLAFDQAYADLDCALHRATTTPAFRSWLIDQDFSCEVWLGYLNQSQGQWDVDIEVLGSEYDETVGDGALVTTHEIDSSGAEYDFAYILVFAGDHWVIDDVVETE